MNKKTFLVGIGILILVACASAGNVYVLDPANNNMRASDPKNDRPLTDCNPETLPSGQKEFKCVGLFNEDYGALLKQIADLQEQLKACQQK